MGNTKDKLERAKKYVNDEFYTQYSTIQDELKHYDFSNKIVYCNCDNSNSQFVKYFQNNPPKQLLYSGFKNGVGTSYDSPEAIELLKQADVIVTNPPFSKLRHYIPFLFKYNKKFIILANINVFVYIDIFPYLLEKKLWLGRTRRKGKCFFDKPDGSQADLSNVCWVTNFGEPYYPDFLELKKCYTKEAYQHYANYNAIEVSRRSDIPFDYDGVMGVPVSFLDKYNPDQFEIIGSSSKSSDFLRIDQKVVQFKGDEEVRVRQTYYGGLVEIQNPPANQTYYKLEDGRLCRALFKRLFIKRKMLK